MEPSPRRRRFRLPALFVLGMLLVQAAWILTVPPFKAADEFDHAYRAASVAHGDWAVPRNGRSLVVVPRSLVEAAQPVCLSLDYTGPETCSPARDLGDGYVEVPSRAANYNPVFYFVVGTVAKPFDGTAALYAMRIAAGLLCAAFVGLAAWATSLWATSRWPVRAMLVGMTPVMLFSLSVMAPNGLEMAAALSLWMSLLGLATPIGRERHARVLLASSAVSGVVVATPRSLGPLWVVLIVCSVALLIGARGVMGILRDNKGVAAIGAAAVSLSALASVIWTRTADTQTLIPSAVGNPGVPTSTLEQVPLWFLQGIAAFPRRSDEAPLLVYPVVGLILLSMLVLGLAVASGRLRILILAIFVAAVAGPALFTVTTIRYTGPIWQGRYGLPFHIGVMLLCGLALERTRHRPARSVAMVATTAAGAMLATANVFGIVAVLLREHRTSPLRDSAAWVSAPAWLVASLVLAGWVAWIWAAMPSSRADESHDGAVAASPIRATSPRPEPRGAPDPVPRALRAGSRRTPGPRRSSGPAPH